MKALGSAAVAVPAAPRRAAPATTVVATVTRSLRMIVSFRSLCWSSGVFCARKKDAAPGLELGSGDRRVTRGTTGSTDQRGGRLPVGGYDLGRKGKAANRPPARTSTCRDTG